MANQQSYQAYPQNLVSGQAIVVNKYTVQVERYLSQGGFAHVYLVRTPTPVYNTTHHVLKRIVVSNESMLSEVRKEVDIMRLLKGHPNIVHLIDAAWHKMPNGLFEVFILMEWCPGGGIIDMMNRRLRERLTEAEILQIFVDVCEGVAFMHNSRPPLLHRDLKVENILQASPTSYKLCDFGSANAVTRPPSNEQEVRALEADLNRHTTLQYRAPEMIDVYSKRPVNEKSDVWALGVLLYKLCYYTTPFEEQGQLAILNVHYRFPSFPEYSEQMRMLISSMLREHGSQRPSVFEILAHVHRLRGTTSSFSYQRSSALSNQALKPKHSVSPNPLRDTVIFTSATSHNTPSSTSRNADLPSQSLAPSSKGQGIQAREKVLDAIAPLRRGRPTSKDQHSLSRPSSPQKNSIPAPATVAKPKDWLSEQFAAEDDSAWKAFTSKDGASKAPESRFDGWTTTAKEDNQSKEKLKQSTGFGDDFAEKLWSSKNPNAQIAPKPLTPKPSLVTSLSPNPQLNVTKISSHAYTGSTLSKPNHSIIGNERDAFDGLGFTNNERPAPTLGEARKLRTGLGIIGQHNANGKHQFDNTKPALLPSRPTPSPRPLLQPRPEPQPSSPSPSGNKSWRSSPQPMTIQAVTSKKPSAEALIAQSRFPSLEELDAALTLSSTTLTKPEIKAGQKGLSQRDIPPQLPPRPTAVDTSSTGLLKPSLYMKSSNPQPQQNAGATLPQLSGNDRSGNLVSIDASRRKDTMDKLNGVLTKDELTQSTKRDEDIAHARAINVNRRKSSAIVRNPVQGDYLEYPKTSSPSKSPVHPKSTPSKVYLPVKSEPKDWLTGEDDEDRNDSAALITHLEATANETPIIRQSPSKRASYIELNDFDIHKAAVAHHFNVAPLDATPAIKNDESGAVDVSPTVSRFKKAFPPIDTTELRKLHVSDSTTISKSPVAETPSVNHIRKDVTPIESSSSADEDGPEHPSGIQAAAIKKKQGTRPKRKGRQSSVHDLVDLWGGGVAPKEKDRPKASPVGNAPANSIFSTSPPQARTSIPTKPLPPVKSAATTAPHSPPRNRSPTASKPAHRRSPTRPVDPKKQSSSGVTQPSGRTRPQSMFIFPSKSEGPTHLAVVTPEEPSSQRETRRTSISNMVQRYEAIGGKNKPSGQSSVPPSPITFTSSGSKFQSQQGSLGFPSKLDVNTNTSYLTSGSSGTAQDSSQTNNLSDRALGLVRAATRSRKSSPLEKYPPNKPDNSDVSSKFPTRRVTQPPPPDEDSHPRGDDGRSPSPERPYQGVGKLIEQWQRKTAEADPNRSTAGAKREAISKKPVLSSGVGDR